VGQVSDFREIFRQIDLDNNGSIDEKELLQLLTSIHGDEHLCSETYIRELIIKVKNVQNESANNVQDSVAMEFTVCMKNGNYLQHISVMYLCVCHVYVLQHCNIFSNFLTCHHNLSD
jgi:hypothetical protein